MDIKLFVSILATSAQVLLCWTVIFKFSVTLCAFPFFGGNDLVCCRLVPGDLILSHE